MFTNLSLYAVNNQMSIHEYIPQKRTEICPTVPSNIFQFTELKFSKMSFITGYSNEMTVCLLCMFD